MQLTSNMLMFQMWKMYESSSVLVWHEFTKWTSPYTVNIVYASRYYAQVIVVMNTATQMNKNILYVGNN